MQSGSTPQTSDYFSSLELPNISDMEIELQRLVQQGVITPEEAQAELVGRSEMNDITLDPTLKKAQMDALAGLQEISDSGGLTASDRADFARIENEENAAARGGREAIIQNAQSRGLGGSGFELMSNLQNEQDAVTRKSQRDLDVAGIAKDRALQALMQAGELGGKIESADFARKADIAGANDAIAKFNAQNKQTVGMANVQAKNNAQMQNLAEKQRVADSNAALQAEQEKYNKNLIQQNYENELKKRSGRAGIAQSNAENAGKDSQNRADANNQLIGGLIGAGASVYGSKKR